MPDTHTQDSGAAPPAAPKWLRNMQNNSWEPEVIISGILLAFIFAFPSQIYEYAAGLIQDAGMDYLGGYILLIYTSIVINVFKIFLITHLVLRFAWAGLLGLSYAFPQGVTKEKLFKISQEYNYQDPKAMLLTLERLCSMSFAFPLTLGMAFAVFTLYLALLLYLHVLLDLDFFVIYLIFMASLLLFSVFMLLNKTSHLKQWISTSMFSSVQATYQSNLGKWHILAYTFFILGLSIPFLRVDMRGFFAFYNEAGLMDAQLEWPNKSMYCADNGQEGHRFPRAFVASCEVRGTVLPLFLPHYARDIKHVSTLRDNFSHELDSLQWHKLGAPTDLYRIYINDSLMAHVPDWHQLTMPQSSQKAYHALLDISHLPTGLHRLRVEKVVTLKFFQSKPTWRHRKNWAAFSFAKVAL